MSESVSDSCSKDFTDVTLVNEDTEDHEDHGDDELYEDDKDDEDDDEDNEDDKVMMTKMKIVLINMHFLMSQETTSCFIRVVTSVTLQLLLTAVF